MDIWRRTGGFVELELICADPALAMSQIREAGIPVYHAWVDDGDILIHLTIERRYFRLLRKLADKKGYCLRLKKRHGLYWSVRLALRRPVLLIGMMLFLMVTLYLPSRVLFFEVEGHGTIPTKLILEKCRDCGITFGVSREKVRSEKMKNARLEAIPQLQWAGINTSGCTAIISVQERSQTEQVETENAVSSIVASTDGVITKCTATAGKLVCKPGQAVIAGEVLISGYTDCGICVRATKAQGEVFAKTKRSLTVVSPQIWSQKGMIQRAEKKFALIIGKKRINFYKDSGILGGTCDKMYSEYYLTLPGGFRLPVIWITEVYTYRTESQIQIEEPSLSVFAQNYLRQQMISGAILTHRENLVSQDGVFLLQGRYICTEMIGRIRNEEIIKPYE